MPKKINTLNPGNLVKINEAGTPISFIFLEYNHFGKNEITLLQEKVYSRHQHYVVTDPTNGRYVDYLDYYCVTQYPLLLDPIIRACLVPVEIISRVRNNTSGSSTYNSYLMTFKRSCFVPSAREYGCSGTSVDNSEGNIFQYFSNGASRAAKTRQDSIDGLDDWADYATRTNDVSANNITIIENGQAYTYSLSTYGETPTYTRIAIAISSDIMVSDNVDSDGCYNIVSAPAAENYQKVNGAWMKMV